MNTKQAAILGGFLAAAVTLAACNGSNGYGSGMSPAAPSPPSGTSPGVTADVTITITGMNGANSFSPNPATVKAGQTVAWRNADSTAHTATADNGSFDTGIIAPGATSSSITMASAGAFGYHCAIHPSMVGSVSVSQ